MDGAQAVTRYGANFEDRDWLFRVMHHIVQSDQRSEEIPLHSGWSVDLIEKNQNGFLGQMRRGKEFEHLNAGGADVSAIRQIHDVDQRLGIFQVVLPNGRHTSADFSESGFDFPRESDGDEVGADRGQSGRGFRQRGKSDSGRGERRRRGRRSRRRDAGSAANLHARSDERRERRFGECAGVMRVMVIVIVSLETFEQESLSAPGATEYQTHRLELSPHHLTLHPIVKKQSVVLDTRSVPINRSPTPAHVRLRTFDCARSTCARSTNPPA